MPLPLDRALREGTLAALAHRASMLIMIALALATTVAVFLTAGRSAAVENDVLASIDRAGTRLVTVQVLNPSPGIGQDGLRRLARATGVEWVLGLGEARDVRNASVPSSLNVAARALLTPTPDVLAIQTGRAPQQGEAIVSDPARRALGLLHPAGTILDSGRPMAVVGQFGLQEDIADLERLVLVGASETTQERATLIYLLADAAANVPLVAAQIPALAGLEGSEGVTISTSDQLLSVQTAVSGQLSQFGRTMAAGALGAGLVLMALATALALSSRRRDHGRRRALGASRSAIVVLAVLEVLFPVALGSLIGTAIGALTVWQLTETLPPLAFLLAVPILVCVVGFLATIPPAAMAAWRDPVRILRVP